MLLVRLQAMAGVLLLGAYTWLPCTHICKVRIHQGFSNCAYVSNQSVEQIERHRLPHDNPKNLRLIFLWWERIVWNDVLLCAKLAFH